MRAQPLGPWDFSSLPFCSINHTWYVYNFLFQDRKICVSLSILVSILNIEIAWTMCSFFLRLINEVREIWIRLWFFFFFRATPVAYGGSPGYGSTPSCGCQPIPQLQQWQFRATSATCATACDKARSLTHWMRPGIPWSISSWILVRFLVCWATVGTPTFPFL